MTRGFWLRFVLLCTLIVGLPACCINTNSTAVEVGKWDGTKSETTLVEHLKHSTVALVMKIENSKYHPERNGMWRPFCAGVWISEDLILTAYHCVEIEPIELPPPLDELLPPIQESAVGTVQNIITYSEARASKIYNLYEKADTTAVVLSVDEKNDLAVLKTKVVPQTHDWVNVSHDDIWDGSTTHIIGHPIGETYTYMKGYVSSTRIESNPADNDEALLLQISAPIWMGNSGGGAFDEKGRLIGICSFVRVNVPNMSYFVHRDVIVKFLKEQKILS